MVAALDIAAAKGSEFMTLKERAALVLFVFVMLFAGYLLRGDGWVGQSF